jgi:PAS domain S-box-containing protein
MKAALPADEGERLKALRRYAILDTPQEEAFDRITHLAARLLKLPMVLVTLIDEDRQWFKSCYGLKTDEIPRGDSFCTHTILSDAALIVPDATLDPRFVDNPFVTGEPYLRFYAGVALMSPEGFKLGSLCAADVEPHKFGAEQEAILWDFAAMVMDELHLRLALRERSQQAAAIANLGSGVVVTDPNQPDNPIIFCNPGFTGMTGYSEAETNGRNCRFLQGPESEPGVVSELRAAMAQGRKFHGLLRNYRKNGEPFWNELSICPVYDKEGKLANFVGLQNDVTERKRAEDMLKESFEKLQHVDSLRESLAGMIVHDLRSPLSAILMSITLLKTRGTGSKEDAKLLGRAQEGAEKLMEMVSQLLDVSRFEAGEMQLEISDCDLLTLVRSAVATLEPLIGKRCLEISGGEGRNVPCDEEIVQRVIGNLLGNALKFTTNGGTVKIQVDYGTDCARVSVTDDGPGIPEEFHGRIFEKFGQLNCGKHHVGTGLGLTFCKLAVEDHGGRIGLQSKVGEGSTFWFELPLGACEAQAG